MRALSATTQESAQEETVRSPPALPHPKWSEWQREHAQATEAWKAADDATRPAAWSRMMRAEPRRRLLRVNWRLENTQCVACWLMRHDPDLAGFMLRSNFDARAAMALVPDGDDSWMRVLRADLLRIIHNRPMDTPAELEVLERQAVAA
jgi:hypothetical protein